VRRIEFYINSGAAGRFENLIWCVEIEGGVERMLSWSDINGRLTRITWKSSHGLLEHESKIAVSA
jgi:hypothetical protein